MKCPYCGEEMEEDYDGKVWKCPNRMCGFEMPKVEFEDMDLEDLVNAIEENLADIRDYWLHQRKTKATIKAIEDLVNETQDLVNELYEIAGSLEGDV
jgi:sarcosine oxidase delta subunit